jgi:hypothetical protein
VAQGGEFRVNTTPTGDQMESAVALDATGNFIITWSSNGQTGNTWGIYGQRYNSAGVAQSSEFLVNPTTAGAQTYSAVAMDTNGNFVVSWSSQGQPGSWNVEARQYSAAGAPVTNEFQVNTTSSASPPSASVALTTTGEAVVLWAGSGTGDTNTLLGAQFANL